MMVLVALLLAGCFVSSPLLAHGRVEVKGTKDYQNIKEDFLCRACVNLGEVFFEDVLTPIAKRYPSTAGKPSSSPAQASRGSRVVHRQREQMVVEVHDAIDGLCESLESSIRQASVAAMRIPAEDEAARQLLSPLVTSKDLRDGVMAACPMALEEMNEALTSTAFRHLLPSEKFTSTTEEAKSELPVYELPAAGTFCEDVGLCSAFVHYHITSDAAVRRRARDAHADAGSDLSRKPTLAEESDAASFTKAARHASTAKNKTSAKKVVYDMTSDDDESFAQTPHRVFQLNTWRQLTDSLNTTEVFSAAYWVDSLRLLMDPDVRFHLQAYVPTMMVYTLCLVAVLGVALMVIFACPRKPRAVAAALPSQSSEQLKKAQ